MNIALKENVSHGTKEFPYTIYHMFDRAPSYQIPVHWHDEMELIYVRTGPLHISINQHEYQGCDGTVLIANPRDLHLMNDPTPTSDYFTFLFPLEFLSFQTNDLLEQELLAPMRNGEKRFLHVPSSDTMRQSISNLFEQLLTLPLENSLSVQLRTRALLLEVFEELISDPGMVITTPFSAKTEMQRGLLLYIQEHYAEKVSLSDLAREFHLSEKYLSRYFKEHFQQTFSNYVIHLRLTQAQKLLTTTELSILEISLQSGFPNVSHFIRTFKKNYGIAPLQYRNLNSLIQFS